MNDFTDKPIGKWFKVGLSFSDLARNDNYDPVGDDFLVGMLIELEDGSKYLIGDVNTLGGVCDDCRAFDQSEIVKRAKWVWRG